MIEKWSQDWQVWKNCGKSPVSSDCDLNQTVSTHVLCTLFTTTLCLDVKENFHFYMLNQMQLKGYLSLKITDFIVCLKNKNRGDREVLVVGSVSPLSRMCPLSERARQRRTGRERGRPEATVLKKLCHRHIMFIKSVCKAILVTNWSFRARSHNHTHAESRCESAASLTRFHY